MRIRIVLALLLILAGVAALVFAAGSDSTETRLGLLMTVVGAWFLLPGRFSRGRLLESPRLDLSSTKEGPSGQSPVGLLLAGLLIAAGAIGLMARVGLRTSAELGLELLLLIVGTSLFVNELRGLN
jgi:hypothetical protein